MLGLKYLKATTDTEMGRDALKIFIKKLEESNLTFESEKIIDK
jgi:hypothetical protein